MAAVWLLSVAAVVEVATGIALIVDPRGVASLLLAADLVGAGIAVGRVAGIALLSLGVVCWMSRQDASKTAVLTAILAYNLLVPSYLTYLGFVGELVGRLLWPAVVIHAVLTLGFAFAWFSDQRTEATTQ
jgi:hypothetical protein